MEEVIKTDHLTKHYRDVKAVEDISLSVGKGEIYGFLGLNGSGKTTTIRMLLGMIRPTAGEAFICGRKVSAGSSRLWEKVGYMVEIPYSYPELTVRENLEIVRRLRLLPDSKATEAVIEKLQLAPYRDRKAKDLSLGNAQRLGLAKALLHGPEILILDEPSNGLDPAGIVEIRKLLLELAREQGVTIFISSHILGEISRLATRIGIVHQGRLVQEMGAAGLEQRLRRRLNVGTLNDGAAREALVQAGYEVKAAAGGHLELVDPGAIAHPEEIAVRLVNAGLPPALLKVEEEDLESYFLRTIGEAAE